MKKIKIIGAGGIGTCLIEPLVRFLNYEEEEVEITIVDGDTYEERNRERQRFSEIGNKAEITVDDLEGRFPKVKFDYKDEYLTEDNIVSFIREKDEVFLCVDNHATRKLVSERAEELNDIMLISGGNDYIDGNVIVYTKKHGKDGKQHNRTMTEIFPEIAEPKDENPGAFNDERQGCEEEVESSPQLLFTNLTIASTMLNCYYAWRKNKLNFEQVCVDIITQASRTKPERF